MTTTLPPLTHELIGELTRKVGLEIESVEDLELIQHHLVNAGHPNMLPSCLSKKGVVSFQDFIYLLQSKNPRDRGKVKALTGSLTGLLWGLGYRLRLGNHICSIPSGDPESSIPPSSKTT